MPTFLLTVLLALAATFPSVRSVERVQRSIVMLELAHADEPGTTGICTGFVIAKNVVLTASHCRAESIKVDGEEVSVIAATTPTTSDLMLLRVPSTRPAVEFSEKTLKPFDEVVGIGYADGMGRQIALRRVVAAVGLGVPSGTYLPPPPGLVVDGIWVPGMSGGPVVDSNGEVVGIMQRFDVSHAFGYGLTTPDILEWVAEALLPALPTNPLLQ